MIFTDDEEKAHSKQEQQWVRRFRRDLWWAGAVGALVAVAFVVPHLHLGQVTPIVTNSRRGYRNFAGTAPLLGHWLPHVGWGTPISLAVAVGTVAWGPPLAQRLKWKTLLVATWIACLLWTMSLALIDGWSRGFAQRMLGKRGLLGQVPRVGNVHHLISSYASHIPFGGPESLNLQSAGHPVGALLTYVVLDRIGLGGSAWAGTLSVLAGTSAAAAVLITIRTLSGEETARRAALFLVVAPAAIWIAVSPDGYFAGVCAWGIALVAMAATRSTRHALSASLGGGLVLGLSLYLSYGSALMVIPVVAILVIARNFRPALAITAGVIAVVLTSTTLGFWWFSGLELLRVRYWSGIAGHRPAAYWLWGNLASLTCAIGLGGATAIRRVFDREALRSRRGLNVLLCSFWLVIAVADLTLMSKAETERIWLPFSVWLAASPALFPLRTHRFWLVIQIVGALLINSLILTAW